MLRRLARTSVTTVVDHLYDRRFNAHTSEVVLDEDYAEQLGAEGRTPTAGDMGHLASDWLTLARILRRSEIGHDDVFLDAGCGQGRMLLEAASRYSFKRVIGVELSAAFAAHAQMNVHRAHAKLQAPVQIVRENIVDYEIPDDVTVAFVGNPFRLDVFAGFMRQLVASLDRAPRHLRLVYVGPREEAQVLATGRFEKVRYGRSLLSGAERHRHIVLYRSI